MADDVDPVGAQLAADRALALVALRPRQAAPPPYEELTESGRAEVDRLVGLIRLVRTQTAEQLRRRLVAVVDELATS